MPSALDNLLEQLGQHPLPTIALGLERIYEALALLGDPHLRVPPVVHVAGTNGKGSTIAFMRSILEIAGYRVHVYTSPHLIRFNERIVLAGKEIEDTALQAVLEEVLMKTEGLPLTFFESTTAAAFLAFSRVPGDVLLLEVGLGGRLDATNVIEKPALTVLTPISYDHMEYLGETLASIATEKAGILKQGIGCIVSEQVPEVMQVIEYKAQEIGAPLYRVQKTQKTAEIQLAGAHQKMNANVAEEAVRHLPMLPISDAQITQGLRKAQWPARLQRVKLQGVPDGVQIYLDGGHNVAGAEALSVWMGEQKLPVHVVLGMLRDKQAVECAKILLQRAASLTLVEIKGEARALPPELFQQKLRKAGGEASVLHDWRTAVDAILPQQPPPLIILIVGSLYLAGDVLKNIEY